MTIFENDLDLETIQKIEKSQADRKEILARLNARAINSKENQFIEDIKKIDFAIHYLQRKEWELEYAKKELEKCKNELLYADHGSILANKALDQMRAIEKVLRKKVLKNDEEIENDL